MNLESMRSQIANLTDFDPEETAYRDQMTALLNEALFEVWSSRAWDFTQRLTYFKVHPDLTSARAGATASTNDGQRIVTFSAAVPSLLSAAELIEGNLIELDGREYEVLQILSDTTLSTVEPIRHTATGTPPTSPATLTGQAWTIKVRYYTLPPDAVEILSISHRDAPIVGSGRPLHSKIWAVSNRPEESLGLREDRTGDYAEMYFPIPPRIIPPAQTGAVSFQLATTGGFVQGKSYEFAYSLMSPDGQEGALSKPITGTVPAPVGVVGTYTATVSFNSFDGVPLAARPTSHATRGNPEPLEGLRKRVYFNANYNHDTGQRLGEPKWLAVTTGAATNGDVSAAMNTEVIAADTASSVSLLYVLGLYPGNREYTEYDGEIRRIRPYPRIDGYDRFYSEVAGTLDRPEEYFRRVELRYRVRPPVLRYDTDTPPLPYEFHRVIVYSALVHVFTKSNNASMSELYQRKRDQGLKDLQHRYMTKIDQQWQRGQFPTGALRYGNGSTIYNITHNG